MNRKPLILGISIAAFLIVLIISGFMLFKEQQKRKAHVAERAPLQRLAYCSSNQVTPCVVSFSLISEGKMLVKFLTTGAFYPDFYLKITQGEEGHIYSCQKVAKFATSVHCIGAVMPIGDVLQFSIYSLKEEVLLAEGKFAIIGMAMGTPEAVSSPTAGTPLTPSLTEEFPLQTPTLVRVTPTLRPSYPNPSYPNPAYP